MHVSPDATIVVMRQPAYSAAAVAFTVKIDGVAAREKLMPNDEIRLQVIPGPHRIQVTMWSRQGSRALTFEAVGGEEVAFVCRGSLSPLHPIELERGPSFAAGAAAERASYPPPAVSYPPPASYPQPQRPQSSQPPRIEVVETSQFEEQLGEEVRVIDNRNSNTGVTRTVRASREWSRTLSVGADQTRTFGGELGGGPAWLKVKGTIEQQLHRTYSTDEHSTRVFAEEITIEVPKQTCVRLSLRWKRIWQRGVVRVTPSDGGKAYDVPYQVVVNVTFDQSQQDEGPEASGGGPPNPDQDRAARTYWTPPGTGQPTV